MRTPEETYDDYLYDCYVANQRLTEEDWYYYGREIHHVEVPKCEGGLLLPLNSQPLTKHQHGVAGVLQSEVVGRKCFAMIPKGTLPPLLEKLRVKWDAKQLTREHQVMAGKCVPLEHLKRIGKLGGSMNKGKPGRKRTEAEIERFREYASLPKSEEHKQKLRENYYDISGWVWITNGMNETMVAPESSFLEGWVLGRKPVTEETREKMSTRMSGRNNPMYGVEPKTKQMRWFKNVEQAVEKMFFPGEEPEGWVKGRLTAQDRR